MHVANARGISLESLMASLLFSTIYCVMQLLLFYYLQSRYPQFYDKYGNGKSSNTNSRAFSDSPDTSRLSCVAYCLYHIRKKNNIVTFLDIEEYRKYGLDSYLFLRFLYVCLYFFVGIALVCLPVLLPVNYLTNSNVNSGLDLISILNIPSDNTYKYIFHFLVTIFIIFWFHYILIHEVNFFVELKFKFYSSLTKYESGERFLKTMYFENIDTERYRTVNELKAVFESFIPNCIEAIYPIYYSPRLVKLVSRYKKLRNQLERHHSELLEYKSGKRKRAVSNSMYLPIKILNSDYEVTIVGLSYKVNKSAYLQAEMKHLQQEIGMLRSVYLQNESFEDPILMNDKVFIVFKNMSFNYILHQVHLSIGKDCNVANLNMVEINPRDINWDKLAAKDNNQNFFVNIKEGLLFFVSAIVIVCWVIPISCVGTISQLNCLTMLIPTMRWINRIPQALQDFISWVLPTTVLTFLTSFALVIFRVISNRKRHITGASKELSIQQWVFVFLFFQLFIVITISSGFIVVLQKLILNPISVPLILAIDFPKASIFFISFFILKGLTILGNNVLQFYYFAKKCFIEDRLLGSKKSQRELHEEELHNLYELENYWGQIYPTFSVYGCIGIVYSIISPVILVFCCINFTLDLIGYKYSIKYTLNRTNRSETYGKLYISAIKQLYAGIYSLEVFEIGFFFSIRDSNGNRSCVALSVLLMAVLCITVYTHLHLNTDHEKGLGELLRQSHQERHVHGRVDGLATHRRVLFLERSLWTDV